MAEDKYLTPSKQLVHNSGERECIDEYVNEILGTVDEEIVKAKEAKLFKATAEIPTLFEVPGMTNQNSQRHVYFQLIRRLEKGGYQVKIDFRGSEATKQKVFVYVTWKTQAESKLEEYMDKYIKAHSNFAQKTGEEQIKPVSRRRRPVRKE